MANPTSVYVAKQSYGIRGAIAYAQDGAIKVISISNAGTYSAAVTASDGGTCSDPSIAISPNGSAHLVYVRSDGSIRYCTAPSANPYTFAASIELGNVGSYTDAEPCVWVTFGGRIYAAWSSTGDQINIKYGDGVDPTTDGPSSLNVGTQVAFGSDPNLSSTEVHLVWSGSNKLQYALIDGTSIQEVYSAGDPSLGCSKPRAVAYDQVVFLQWGINGGGESILWRTEAIRTSTNSNWNVAYQSVDSTRVWGDIVLALGGVIVRVYQIGYNISAYRFIIPENTPNSRTRAVDEGELATFDKGSDTNPSIGLGWENEPIVAWFVNGGLYATCRVGGGSLAYTTQTLLAGTPGSGGGGGIPDPPGPVDPPTPGAPPVLASLTIYPSSIEGGQPATGTIKLNKVALTGGFATSVTSNDTGVATVPPTVTVPAGSLSTTFVITTLVQTTIDEVGIAVSAPGSTLQSAYLDVYPVDDPSLPPPGDPPPGDPPTTGPDVTIEPSQGQRAVLVTVDASSSTDLDGEIVKWVIDIGGTVYTFVPPAIPKVTHMYTQNSPVTVILTVTDNEGETATLTKVVPFDETTLPQEPLVTAELTVAAASQNGEKTWSVAEISAVTVAPVAMGSVTCWGCNDGRLYTSSDFLGTSPILRKTFADGVSCLWNNEEITNRWLAGLDNGQVWLSEDSGLTWTQKAKEVIPPWGSSKINDISESPKKANQATVAAGNDIYTTFDLEHWTSLMSYSSEALRFAAGFYEGKSYLYAAYANGHIQRWSNPPDSIEILGAVPDDHSIRGLTLGFDEHVLYIGTDQAADNTYIMTPTGDVTAGPPASSAINRMIRSTKGKWIYVAADAALQKWFIDPSTMYDVRIATEGRQILSVGYGVAGKQVDPPPEPTDPNDIRVIAVVRGNLNTPPDYSGMGIWEYKDQEWTNKKGNLPTDTQPAWVTACPADGDTWAAWLSSNMSASYANSGGTMLVPGKSYSPLWMTNNAGDTWTEVRMTFDTSLGDAGTDWTVGFRGVESLEWNHDGSALLVATTVQRATSTANYFPDGMGLYVTTVGVALVAPGGTVIDAKISRTTDRPREDSNSSYYRQLNVWQVQGGPIGDSDFALVLGDLPYTGNTWKGLVFPPSAIVDQPEDPEDLIPYNGYTKGRIDSMPGAGIAYMKANTQLYAPDQDVAHPPKGVWTADTSIKGWTWISEGPGDMGAVISDGLCINATNSGHGVTIGGTEHLVGTPVAMVRADRATHTALLVTAGSGSSTLKVWLNGQWINVPAMPPRVYPYSRIAEVIV